MLNDNDDNNLENFAYECGITQSLIQRINQEHGWNDKEVHVPEALALIHSEISEALEEYRKDPKMIAYASNEGKPEGIAVELADAAIRILHLSERLGFNLGDYIADKTRYNDTRPYRHGGKAC